MKCFPLALALIIPLAFSHAEVESSYQTKPFPKEFTLTAYLVKKKGDFKKSEIPGFIAIDAGFEIVHLPVSEIQQIKEDRLGITIFWKPSTATNGTSVVGIFVQIADLVIANAEVLSIIKASTAQD